MHLELIRAKSKILLCIAVYCLDCKSKT